MHSLNDVLKHCTPYIKILQQGERGCFLTRGVADHNIDISLETLSVSERIPRDMPLEVHNAINDRYINIFGWPIRNGLFSFAVKNNFRNLNDLGYGRTYLLFPCDEFYYVSDKNVFDLYASYHEFCCIERPFNLETFLSKINYSDCNLNSIMSKISDSNRSVEIIINCKNYYLLKVDYVEELTSIIWQ